jgi:hypothetical protein
MNLARERETVAAMVRLYCEDHHPAPHPCPACSALLEYAGKRLAACPFGAGKPVCAKCPVHCYSPRRREQIREVMRYSGPKMLLRHPVLATRHLLHKTRRPPAATT